MDLRLGFLASHGGSNVEAILNNIENGSLNAKGLVVICNNPGARVLDVGLRKGLDCYCMNFGTHADNLNFEIAQMFRDYDVNLVVAGGYMKTIGDAIIEAYPNRVLNIHPALLPKYGGKGMYGKAVHRAVLDSGDVVSGASVHIVTKEYDRGKVIGQCTVSRYDWDDVESLAKRVLEVEHALYSRVLRDVGSGVIDLDL